MRRLVAKVALMAVVLLASSLALGTILHGPLRSRLDPRRALFFGPDPRPCGIALLGDSVFGSYYVDRADQALWSRLEQLTGRCAFPAALNAARSADVLAAARLLAPRLTPGTAVFVDVPPFKIWERSARVYEYEFAHYGGFLGEPLTTPQRIWNSAVQPLVSRLLLWRDAPLLAGALVERRHFAKGEYRDRVWDRPPDYARQRFELWVGTFLSGEATRDGDLSMLREIAEVLRRAGHRPTILLSPLNRALVARFADPALAARIDAHLRARHDRTLAFLRTEGIDVLDLADAVPADGFADLAHTNAAGDDLMARAMAAHLANGAPR